MTETTTETATETTTETATQSPEWLSTLPDELKVDATLQRYADVPALARAHIEAHKVAKSKFSVPGDGAAPEEWGKVWDALGRPESADGYDVPMPELSVDATDDMRAELKASYAPFRELAHEIGLNPAQAKALGQFELDRQNAYHQKTVDEVNALKQTLGKDYAPKLKGAQATYARIFGADEDALLAADDFERKLGSATLIKGMMRLAEIAGEHGIVEADTVEGFGEVKDAEGKLAELQADATWRQKFDAGDASVVKQRERLLEVAQKQALRRSATANI